MNAVGRPDVVIIGGGVMGCALAYYLARAGESVMLLEQGRVGSVPSASGRSYRTRTAISFPSRTEPRWSERRGSWSAGTAG